MRNVRIILAYISRTAAASMLTRHLCISYTGVFYITSELLSPSTLLMLVCFMNVFQENCGHILLIHLLVFIIYSLTHRLVSVTSKAEADVCYVTRLNSLCSPETLPHSSCTADCSLLLDNTLSIHRHTANITHTVQAAFNTCLTH